MVNNEFVGEDSPIPGKGSASVQYGNTFALVGGYYGAYYDTIQVFDPDTLTFTLLDERLTVGRRSAAAILVNKEMFPDCE